MRRPREESRLRAPRHRLLGQWRLAGPATRTRVLRALRAQGFRQSRRALSDGLGTQASHHLLPRRTTRRFDGRFLYINIMANTLTDFTLCLEDEDGAAQTIDSFRVQVFDIDRDDDGFDEVRCASRGLLCLRRPSRSAPCPPISRLPPSVHTPATPHLTSHLPPATHTAHTPRLCHTHAPTLLHPHPQIVRIKVDEGGAFFPLSGSSTDTYLESATGTTDDGYDFASRRSGDQVLLPLPLPSLQGSCPFPVGVPSL